MQTLVWFTFNFVKLKNKLKNACNVLKSIVNLYQAKGQEAQPPPLHSSLKIGR